MPRKATKKLFRRGDTQKYKKTIRRKKSQKAVKPILTKQSGFYIFRLILLMGLSALVVLLLPTITSDIRIIIRLANNQLIHLLNFVNDSTRTVHFEMSKLTIPEVDFEPILEFSKKVIDLLDPKPLFKLTISILNQLNFATTINSLWSLKIISAILTYLDPRPGLTIIAEFLTKIAIFALETTYYLLTLMNPLPGMKRISEIEILIITEMFNSLVVLLLFIINFFYLVLEFLLNGLSAVFNFIARVFNGIISAIYNTISGFLDEIRFRIDIVAEFLNPYINIIVNNFKNTVNGLLESAKYLKQFIKAIVNQYNEYHPR